jgi:hypothetical protein
MNRGPDDLPVRARGLPGALGPLGPQRRPQREVAPAFSRSRRESGRSWPPRPRTLAIGSGAGDMKERGPAPHRWYNLTTSAVKSLDGSLQEARAAPRTTAFRLMGHRAISGR